jgi:hypothetical protein
MSLEKENTTSNQDKAEVNDEPKPFNPNDKVRAADLEKRFGPKLENKYTLNGVTVEISGRAIVSKVPDSTLEGYTSISPKKEEYTIELPVTITDPNASGDFKNVGRWSKYILTIDKNTGDVTQSSRIDRRFDEKQQQYYFDGATYQIYEPEVDALLQTQAVQDVLKR